MKILGIMWEENSTAALYVDGKIAACVSEERFTRQKNDECYPKQAIEYVLKEGGIEAKDLDYVAFTGTIWDVMHVLTRRYSSYSVDDRLREQREYWYPLFYENKAVHYFDIFKDKLDTEQYPGQWDDVLEFMKDIDVNPQNRALAKDFFQKFRKKIVSGHLGIPEEKIVFIDHHEGHAAYAYHSAPHGFEEEILVLTADAWGDELNATVSIASKGELKRIAASDNFRGAHLYRYITQLMGMKPDQDEFKVMGLAPYGKKKYYQPVYDIFKETQYVDGLGFAHKTIPTDHYYYFKDKLEGKRFDNIAAGLQAYTEDLIVTWVKNAIEKTGIRKIRFAGGIAMNIKAMMEVAKLPGVEIFVPSAPSDESEAVGVTYVLARQLLQKSGGNLSKVAEPFIDSYLGPDITTDEIENLLKSENVSDKFTVIRNPELSLIASALVEGKVIARCVGRSEFGPRALGNRSIIADPRNFDIIKKINNAIKSRDFWMPFAASILERRAGDYLIGFSQEVGAPYMTLAFETTPLAHKHLKAGLHPEDLTCRPQVIRPGQNPGYEALIGEFEKQTGVGGVLNTSFNLHGEPIVQTAADAYRVFCLSDIDGLLLDKALILKK